MSIIEAGGGKVDIIQEGKGKDLILLPTLLADRSVYDEVAPYLAKFRLVTRIDFPGFGGSTSVGPRVEDYATMVVDTLNAIKIPHSRICWAMASVALSRHLGDP